MYFPYQNAEPEILQSNDSLVVATWFLKQLIFLTDEIHEYISGETINKHQNISIAPGYLVMMIPYLSFQSYLQTAGSCFSFPEEKRLVHFF